MDCTTPVTGCVSFIIITIEKKVTTRGTIVDIFLQRSGAVRDSYYSSPSPISKTGVSKFVMMNLTVF